MPIRRSPNGAGYTRPQPGRDPPEWVVAINRNGWSQSIVIGGRNQPVRPADVKSIYNYERTPSDGISRAFAEVAPRALARSFEQEKARAIQDATRYAFENCGAKPGDMLTDEQKVKLPGLLTESLMPFILRHAARR